MDGAILISLVDLVVLSPNIPLEFLLGCDTLLLSPINDLLVSSANEVEDVDFRSRNVVFAELKEGLGRQESVVLEIVQG